MRRGQSPMPTFGLTLVEVLVALTVLTVNVLAIAGVLLGAIDLSRRVEIVAQTIEDGVTVPACAAGLLLLWPPRRRWRSHRHQAGFTLVEVLVALALASIVLTVVASFMVGGVRASTSLTDRSVDQEARIAIPAILTELVTTAGAGIGGTQCALGISSDGLVLVFGRAEADGPLRIDEIFAALDGGGRPALYHRHRPYARQPWLEDVTAFDVVGVLEAADGRVDAVDLRIVHRHVRRPIEVQVPLPHRPCRADDL